MSENISQISNKKTSKKRIFLFIIVVLCAVIGSLFGFLYLKQKFISNHQKNSSLEDGGLFEFSDGSQDKNQDNEIDLDELKAQTMNENGSEFIYKIIIKNQNQIEELQNVVQSLKSDISKLRSQEKISKILINYVGFRDKFFTKKNFDNELQNLYLLSLGDNFLGEKLKKMQDLSEFFATKFELETKFAFLIPELIAVKNSNIALKSSSNLGSKILNQLSRLVIIRKINSKNPQELDYIISKIESNLKNQDYVAVMTNLESLDQSYSAILSDFIKQLSLAIEALEADKEILNHLKNLS